MRLGLVTLALTGFLGMGCSTITTQYDYDPKVQFDDYQTFAWHQEQKVAVGDARAAMQMNTLLDNRIRDAVREELTSKGLTEDTSSPQILLVYHTGVQDKVQVSNYGYGYGYGYYGWGGRAVDVYEYQEGTLVIDLIDTKTQQLIWRGWATGTIDENPDPETAQQRIQNVVHKIFEDYPPPPYVKKG